MRAYSYSARSDVSSARQLFTLFPFSWGEVAVFAFGMDGIWGWLMLHIFRETLYYTYIARMKGTVLCCN